MSEILLITLSAEISGEKRWKSKITWSRYFTSITKTEEKNYL